MRVFHHSVKLPYRCCLGLTLHMSFDECHLNSKHLHRWVLKLAEGKYIYIITMTERKKQDRQKA